MILLYYDASIIKKACLLDVTGEGGNYMITVCRGEISLHPAGADLTLSLHGEIEFTKFKTHRFPFSFFCLSYFDSCS